MKIGRLLVAAALLTVTSVVLVSGTLPVVVTAGGAQSADGAHGTVVHISGHYLKQ